MWDWVSKLQELLAAGAPVAIVTVTRCSGSTPRETGAKMLVAEDGRFFGTIGGGQLEKQVIEDSLIALAEGQSRTLHFPLHASVGQCCGGVVELLVEVMNRGPELYIFGTGHVGQALARTLAETPFSVTLVDERAEISLAARIPSSVRNFCGKPCDFLTKASFKSDRTYVAIMTHDHDLDFQIISTLLQNPDRYPMHYLGLIGSDSKWKSFQNRLKERGIPEERLRTVHCPIGLPIGGKSPQEVSISIAAELLKVFNAE